MIRPRVSSLTLEEFLELYPRIAGGDGADDPAPEPAPNYGPWINDLRSVFGDDPEVLGKADQYMREYVQPHTTSLEQEVADFNRLREDLATDPEGTLAAVAQELWQDDPDRVAAVAQALGITNEEAAEALAEAEAPEPETEEEQPVEYPPEIQKLIERQQQEELAELYATKVTKLKADNPDLEIDSDLFAPFAAAANGDYDAALEGYKSWQSTWESKFKPADDETPEAETPTPIGSSSATTTSTPPVQKQYTMDSALDELVADMRAAADATPTPVGGV